MSFNPSVRLLAEGSEDLIAELPASGPSLNKADNIVLTLDGSAAVTYKIEESRYVCEGATRVIAGLPDRYNVYCRLDYIVSVVP